MRVAETRLVICKHFCNTLRKLKSQPAKKLEQCIVGYALKRYFESESIQDFVKIKQQMRQLE